MLVELAANGVDAARAAGEPGRLLLRLVGPPGARELRLANNGNPLTSAGVAALASLRASAKRESANAVGHFGVGFTAVLAISDRPEVHSTTGGVRFDRSATEAAIELLGNADLSREAQLRQGVVPVLRLVWPIDPGQLPDGFTTEVVLPLTGHGQDRIAALLAVAGPELFWALPDLESLRVELPGQRAQVWTRVVGPDGLTTLREGQSVTAYRSVSVRGTIPAELLADRPVEERSRNRWQLSWILPIEPDDVLSGRISGEPAVTTLGAPTPTDEQLSLPARLVGTFPVDDTRRRLAAGPLTTFLLERAADAYVELIDQADPADRLPLIPTAGFPLGQVDAVLRAAIISAAARRAVLRTSGGEPVTPRSACVIAAISADASRLLEEALPGLLDSPHSRAETEAMRALGVQVLPLSAATEALASLDRGPAFWFRVYTALADADAESLADLPVPLAGGGRRIGPRTCLLVDPGAISADLLGRTCGLSPDLPIVHPDAVHPLLERLGAAPADAGTLLADPGLVGVFEEFRSALEDADPDPEEADLLAGIALDLAESAGPSIDRQRGALAHLVLTDEEETPWPAAELLMPDAPLARVLADDADLPAVADRWVAGWPAWVLAAAGVSSGLRLVHVVEPVGPSAELPQAEEWWAEVVAGGPPPAEYSAVADLDLIADGAWLDVLGMIESDRAVRHSLMTGPQPSYTGWWLGRYAEIAGAPINRWRTAGAHDLVGLYDEFPVALTDDLAVAVGVLDSATAAARTDPEHLLRRYADPQRAISAARVPALTKVIADLLTESPDLDLPDLVRTLSGAVVYARNSLVLDLPWLAQVISADRLVPGGADPGRVAAALDLKVASAVTRFSVSHGPVEPADPQGLALVADALGVGVPGSILAATELKVSVAGGAPVPVAWWPVNGSMLVDGSPKALGRAVAYLGKRWSDRYLALAAASADPVAIAEYGIE